MQRCQSMGVYNRYLDWQVAAVARQSSPVTAAADQQPRPQRHQAFVLAAEGKGGGRANSGAGPAPPARCRAPQCHASVASHAATLAGVAPLLAQLRSAR